jgi:hypothetical protein
VAPWCGEDGGRRHKSGETRCRGGSVGMRSGMGCEPPCCVRRAQALEAPSGRTVSGARRGAVRVLGAALGVRPAWARAPRPVFY